MEAKIYDRSNFHKNTFCIFKEVNFLQIENRKIDYKSKSGSVYYFTELGVYRLSNHWGRAANCKWRLEPNSRSETRTKLGFALWTSFHRDNDTEKLYFIEADLATNSASFQHKDSENYQPEYVLRTASETTIRIKQIRNLIATDSWTKYSDKENKDDLKRKVIYELITTNKTLQQIKSVLL